MKQIRIKQEVLTERGVEKVLIYIYADIMMQSHYKQVILTESAL